MAVAVVCCAGFIALKALCHDAAPVSAAGSIAGGFAYAVFQWCCIVAVLGFGRRWLGFDAPARRYLADAVFPFYIVHQTAIVATSYAIRDLGWSVWSEALLVIMVTLAICFATYEVVRRVDWLRPWFGLKRTARPEGRFASAGGE